MNKLQKMLDKKKMGGHGLSDIERDAKMSVVDAMKEMANDEMSGRLNGLKKVSVASNSPEGLEKGLDKAKELVRKGPEASLHDSDMEDLEEDAHEDLDHDNEEGESPEHQEKVLGHLPEEDHEMAPGEEESEYGHMSEDELDAKLQELMKLKAMKSRGV